MPKSLLLFVIFSGLPGIEDVAFRMLEGHAAESEHHVLVGMWKLILLVHATSLSEGPTRCSIWFLVPGNASQGSKGCWGGPDRVPGQTPLDKERMRMALEWHIPIIHLRGIWVDRPT